MFSVGIILAELLLSHPDTSSPRQIDPQTLSSFPSSPPHSRSPPTLTKNVPLLSTYNNTRRSFIQQIIRLFGQLPPSFRAGKFWHDDFAAESFAPGGTSLSQQLEMEGVDADLVDFIMRMVQVDPARRISAREALRHEWLIGPLLGYWAVAGIEWRPAENPEKQVGSEIVQEKSIEIADEDPIQDIQGEPQIPRFYDFAKLPDEDESIEDPDEEVSLVYLESSPTKPLPMVDRTAQEDVPVTINHANSQDGDDDVVLL